MGFIKQLTLGLTLSCMFIGPLHSARGMGMVSFLGIVVAECLCWRGFAQWHGGILILDIYNWHRIGTGPRESMSHESTLKFVQNLCFLILHFLAETQSTWGLWYLDIFVSHTWEVAIYFFVWWVECLSLAVILHDDNHIAPQKMFPNKYEQFMVNYGKFM